jgi:hypothetical protein
MTTLQKIKKTLTIALGFALATYLIMSGMAMLNQNNKATTPTKKVQ